MNGITRRWITRNQQERSTSEPRIGRTQPDQPSTPTLDSRSQSTYPPTPPPPCTSWPTSTAGPIQPLTARILAARGLDLLPPDDLLAFLDPKLKRLHDPSLLPGVDKAADRILLAINNSEQIAIYGDYDVDGVTASAILFHACKSISPDAKITTYIPHRLDEGYGLNADALTSIAQAGAQLVITVDCGITATNETQHAKTLGIDLIITDHHNPPENSGDIPDAFAVVHPRLPGSRYPFPELCGAGVAFKLAWRLATLHAQQSRPTDAENPKVSDHARAVLLDLLAFAALGTIADIVPLVGETRVIARAGLAAIQPSARRQSPVLQGLGALVRAAGLDGESINAMDVGFKLGPMLNAAGRLDHAQDAVELFTNAHNDRAATIAASLNTLNRRRRDVEQQITEHAAQLANDAGMTSDETRAIVLAHEDWHPGVIGVVCSRLVERFGRPTILMNIDHAQSLVKGSARSIDGFNLHAALCECSQHLQRFGGHDMAAGLAASLDALEHFTAAFINIANTSINPADLVPALQLDCAAPIAECTLAAVEQLESLAPFGRDNPQPRILLRNLTLIERPRLLGQAGKHLALRVADHSKGHALRIVAWNKGHLAEQLAAGVRIDAVITPKINTFNNNRSVEAELHDLRIHTAAAAASAADMHPPPSVEAAPATTRRAFSQA